MSAEEAKRDAELPAQQGEPSQPDDSNKRQHEANEPASAQEQAGSTARMAEEAAKKAKIEVSAQSMPSRQYLEGSVVPILMGGMQELAKERPEDPVEYLAAYLVKHNPKKKDQRS
jgi:protein dpy-30